MNFSSSKLRHFWCILPFLKCLIHSFLRFKILKFRLNSITSMFILIGLWNVIWISFKINIFIQIYPRLTLPPLQAFNAFHARALYLKFLAHSHMTLTVKWHLDWALCHCVWKYRQHHPSLRDCGCNGKNLILPRILLNLHIFTFRSEARQKSWQEH